MEGAKVTIVNKEAIFYTRLDKLDDDERNKLYRVMDATFDGVNGCLYVTVVDGKIQEPGWELKDIIYNLKATPVVLKHKWGYLIDKESRLLEITLMGVYNGDSYCMEFFKKNFSNANIFSVITSICMTITYNKGVIDKKLNNLINLIKINTEYNFNELYDNYKKYLPNNTYKPTLNDLILPETWQTRFTSEAELMGILKIKQADHKSCDPDKLDILVFP